MIKMILIGVVVVIAGILVFAATKPDTLHVRRSVSIKAPPEKIFPYIDDLHRWSAWSPYENKDPAMKKKLSGTASGKGAIYEWDGNSSVGQGRMEITASVPPSKDTIKLDFIKPFEGHNVAEFTLEPKGDATNVTWTMDGPAPFISKIMQVFVNMDTMIGKDFEVGLANLKALAEK
jgi:Polyketide cyclase / dehydrase and lipid transport